MKLNSYVNIPLPTLKRFPVYLGLLKECRDQGEEWISASYIAGRLNLKSIQVRKDLSCTGVVGKPKKGFLISEMMEAISFYLGEGNLSDVLLVGVGNLGKALLADRRLTRHGFEIVAAFDVDEKIVGTEIAEHKVYAMDKLSDLIKRMGIKVAILTVPEKEAQPIADKLVEAGILGIWNFSSLFLDVKCEVTVINEDLGARLALLAGRVTHGSGCGDKTSATSLGSLSFKK
ncbi:MULTISPECIES: redox-sensing transcriptional repressor Rex [unclassified Oceanispirochaeta]|uniref:redox-sensing transcriptional repressor Rex n=1 Tax=unclassified Oceanispirochaeta TaxID=2635722 RepID=UPI000E09AA3B|nr:MULTISPECIES: redox-sensing transcriptional repressor Rex [unclassified Oceanispirochaeta]MBF9018577.1 redox-sensing transcriptional repressor Rex [Oceanispirochaeta sp. M2]NPD75016.1 redox-sensing transcriptional repressor Rex [Oceanispirochaeta sp. M1]RDG29137.1 redox-sensing transcriptional repressor Rex [Oceanispirochaeta sp. M1]